MDHPAATSPPRRLRQQRGAPVLPILVLASGLLALPSSCSAQTEQTAPVEEYVQAVRAERPNSARIASLRAALLKDPQLSVPPVIRAIRDVFGVEHASDVHTIRSLCALLNDLAAGPDRDALRTWIVGELATCVPYPVTAAERVESVFPIVKLRADLGDETASRDLVVIASNPLAPTWMRIQSAEVLLPEDTQGLKILMDVVANPREPLDERICASRLLARFGHDSEALHFALRLATGETVQGDTMEGGRQSDGYSILCEIAKRNPEILSKVLTDLHTVDDLFTARTILRTLDDAMNGTWPQGGLVVGAVREYMREVLAGHLGFDGENISAAMSTLRKSGLVSEAELLALNCRVEALSDAPPEDDLEAPGIDQRMALPREPESYKSAPPSAPSEWASVDASPDRSSPRRFTRNSSGMYAAGFVAALIGMAAIIVLGWRVYRLRRSRAPRN